jgi:hypothetical protein
MTMTQYMLSVLSSAEIDAANAALTPEQIQPMFDSVDRFNDKLKAEGAWVFAGGLTPMDTATRVDNTGAEPLITDGPFAESKEWIGGFWILELPDLDAALQWATEASKACAGKVEVRPFQPEPAA